MLRRILEKKTDAITIDETNLAEFAGVRKYRYGVSEVEDQIGAVTGLAWTEVGGELLTIEAVTVPGKGLISTTGKLGDVMKESVQAAFSFVKARSPAYGVRPSLIARKDIHIHLPEGAVPKDGPSAGIGIATAIISTLTGVAVRRDVAMTGEVTLRGRVLPIGGLKEKLLAALRGGITTVLIPAENEKDLVDIPATITDGLTIVPVSHLDEVLARALVSPIVADRVDRGGRTGRRRARPTGRSGGRSGDSSLIGAVRRKSDASALDSLRIVIVSWTRPDCAALARSGTGTETGASRMNKQELIGAVAETAGLTRSDASKAVESVFDAIGGALTKGDEVRLVGFGTFSVSKRKASTGRNPRTGEPMSIAASSQPKFKAGKGLKDAVN